MFPKIRYGGGLILKSLNHWVKSFYSSYSGGACPYGGAVVPKRGKAI